MTLKPLDAIEPLKNNALAAWHEYCLVRPLVVVPSPPEYKMVSFKVKQFAVAVGAWAVCAVAQAAGITQISYSSLLGQNPQRLDFSSVGCASGVPLDAFGCSVEGQLQLGNARLGERFKGQSVSPSGDFDALSAPPSLGQPLQVLAGAIGENLYVKRDSGNGGVLMGGVGPAGSEDGIPFPESAGKGALSVFFDGDQSQFGLQIFNWDGGDAPTLFIAFFDILGNRLGDVFELNPKSDPGRAALAAQAQAGQFDLAFRSSEKNIAGVSIWNVDSGGLNFTGMIYDQAGVRGGGGGDVPEPGALLLAGLALVAASRATRRR